MQLAVKKIGNFGCAKSRKLTKIEAVLSSRYLKTDVTIWGVDWGVHESKFPEFIERPESD